MFPLLMACFFVSGPENGNLLTSLNVCPSVLHARKITLQRMWNTGLSKQLVSYSMFVLLAKGCSQNWDNFSVRHGEWMPGHLFGDIRPFNVAHIRYQ